MLGLGILVPASMQSSVLCVHPWNLVPKSCGTLSRLVTDASALTKFSYTADGHCASSPILGPFLSFLSRHGQGLCHLEWDFRSFFYQIPLSEDVQPLFTLQLLSAAHQHTKYYQHTVLPQGWRPSSTIAQTVAVLVCLVLMLRAAAEVECGLVDVTRCPAVV